MLPFYLFNILCIFLYKSEKSFLLGFELVIVANNNPFFIKLSHFTFKVTILIWNIIAVYPFAVNYFCIIII